MRLFYILAEHERNILRERTQADSHLCERVDGRAKGLSPRYVKIKDLVKAAHNNVKMGKIMLTFKIIQIYTLQDFGFVGSEVRRLVKRK